MYVGLNTSSLSLTLKISATFQPIAMDDTESQSYSLTEFCTTAKILLDSGDSASFVKFVLCGRYQNRQVVVDAIQNRLDPEYPIKGLRDFDSLLGIHKDIPVHSSLTLFPLARKEDTLRTNVHLSYSFNFPGVSYMILNQENFHH